MRLTIALPVCLFACCASLQAQDRLQAKSAIGKLNDAPSEVPAPSTIRAASLPIAIKLTTDKTSYTEGEVVKLTLNTPKAGHVRIYYADAEGNVMLLFPTSAILDEARAKNAKVTDEVPAGESIISGRGSVTGIQVKITPPAFGAEQIAAIVTDVPVKEDATFIAALSKTKSASDATQLLASLAIRQDLKTKSAIGRVNDDGVPDVLAAVGLSAVDIRTKAKD